MAGSNLNGGKGEFAEKAAGFGFACFAVGYALAISGSAYSMAAHVTRSGIIRSSLLVSFNVGSATKNTTNNAIQAVEIDRIDVKASPIDFVVSIEDLDGETRMILMIRLLFRDARKSC